MKLSRSLSVLVVLQTMTLLGVWSMSRGPEPVHAQVPDGGAQRAATIEELRALNAKLDKLTALLSDGNLQVRVVRVDENK